MEKRGGTSISTKLILTTTALVAVIVILLGLVDAYQTSRIFDEQAARLSAITHEELARRGEVQTRDLAQASRNAAMQSDYSTLQAFVPQVAPRGDRDVAWVLVTDADGVILAHSDPRQNGLPVTDAIGRELIAARGPQTRDSVPTPDGRLSIFSRPIEHDHQRLGTVIIAFRLAPLEAQVASIATEKAQAAAQSTRRTVLLGLLFLLCGTAVAVFQSLRISKPLALLAWRADRIAHGDLESRVAVASSDEIGRLGQSFNDMADQLVVLLRNTTEKALLEKELELAQAIQETLVPPSDLLERPGVSLAGYFAPASRVGGDWWTVHDLPGDRLLVLIGDVTGHGTAAAMITACAKAATDTLRRLAGDRLTVGPLLAAINHAVYETARRKFVMTCFASILDPRARTITFANAGHQFPYLLRGGASGDELSVLMARGNALGDAAEGSWAERTQTLERGDALVWYTDGVVECEGVSGEEFGEKRFRAALKQAGALPARALRDALVGSAMAFYGAQARKDDITLVVARLA